MLGMQTEHEVLEVGQLRPDMTATPQLSAGEVGYIVANIKTLADVIVGDTDHPPRRSKAALRTTSRLS